MGDLVELVNLPQGGIVKMVQLLMGERRDRKVIVFGSEPAGDGEYHAGILGRYLDSQGIAWKPDLDSNPDRRGMLYFMSGAGHAQVDAVTKTIALYGWSGGYRIGPDCARFADAAADGWTLRFRR